MSYMSCWDMLTEKSNPEHPEKNEDDILSVIYSRELKNISSQRKSNKNGNPCYSYSYLPVGSHEGHPGDNSGYPLIKNGKKDYIRHLLTMKTPVREAVQLALSYYNDPDIPLSARRVPVYDPNGKLHFFSCSDSAVIDKVLSFLTQGPQNPTIFNITRKSRQHIRAHLASRSSEKSFNNDEQADFASFLQQQCHWTFQLKDCAHLNLLVEWLCDSVSDSGCNAINEALWEKINDTRFGYSSMFHSDDTFQHFVPFLQPQTVIWIIEKAGESKNEHHFQIDIRMDPRMMTDLTRLECDIREEMKDTPYTISDTFGILGDYAMQASQLSGNGYYLPLTLNERDPHSARHEFLERMRKIRIIDIIESGNSSRDVSLRFKNKPQRIILSAIGRAALDNRLSRVSTPKEYMDLIDRYPSHTPKFLQNFGLCTYKSNKLEAFNINHIYVNFNWAASYYCAYARALELKPRNELLNLLERLASDFRTGEEKETEGLTYNRRILQIKSLTILCYYLLLNDRLSHQEEIELFRICYSENWYPIQTLLVHCLLEYRPFYQEIIRDTFIRNCRIADDGYAVGQPYYFLLQSLVMRDPKEKKETSSSALNHRTSKDISSASYDFLADAIHFHAKNWGATRPDREAERIIQALEDIQAAGEHLAACADADQKLPAEPRAEDLTAEHFLHVVYGLQAYGYGLANILALQMPLRAALIQYLTDPAVRLGVFRALILADYFTRKCNRVFDLGTYGPENDLSPDRLFLPCGPQRFFCAYRRACREDDSLTLTRQCVPGEELLSDSLSLPDSVIRDYRRWLPLLISRRPRHACLLLRVLAHSNFPVGDFLPDPADPGSASEVTAAEKAFREIAFLPYDEMEESYCDFRRELTM